MITLILGGARSGKSHLAQQYAEQSSGRCVYLATAQAQDEEMQARISAHQQQRDERWVLCEEPLQLSDALSAMAGVDTCVVVDCLTLWLSNVLAEGYDVATRIDTLLATAASLPGQIIFVNNEVGQGVVPLGALTRQFVDHNGRLNQQLAQLAGRVILVVAGLTQQLK